MDLVKQFREYTRQLECHLGNINSADCCCCSVNKRQCFLIVEIGRKPGISVKELADILRIDKSGVSRLVEDLVRKEFVERKPSAEDRRFVTLNLLPKGQERFGKIEHDMYYRFKEVLEQIPEDKQEQVVEALKIYNEACSVVEDNSND
ncbi:MAG: winged helix-turn-helix transcriptional regulator [Lachnospiraceae bacterium]|nr:winged helix-turn-helix transcriptional regulator [Lachnospiraceae bacterium]